MQNWNCRCSTGLLLVVALWLVLLGGCTSASDRADISRAETQMIRKISAGELADLVQNETDAACQGSVFEITGRVVRFREVFNTITIDTERTKAGYPILVETVLTDADSNNGKWQSLSEGCIVTVRAVLDKYDDNFLITLNEGVLMDIYADANGTESGDDSGAVVVPEKDTLKSFVFVVSSSTRTFHLDSCSAVKRLKPDNRQDVAIQAVNYTLAVEKMKASGYTGCKKCVDS